MSIPQKPEERKPSIDEAIDFLATVIKPMAQVLDTESCALSNALSLMADAGLLGLRVPRDYGGAGFEEKEFRRFQEECARASGCLAFLQTQHQSACSMLAKSENLELKERLLPRMATGEELCGIAFSQLRRRSATPVLRADPVDDGFCLIGSAPWVTGLGFFKYCITACTLAADETLFVLHSLADGTGLQLSPPMRLASLEPANTVSATFSNYLVPSSNVLYVRTGNWIENNDMINVALQSPFALGCARAGLDVVNENFERKELAGIGLIWSQLTEELNRCREEAYAAMDDRENQARSLQARAWAIDMALRCAAAAVVSSSGAGNAASHPAQRIYREALVFSVSAQTADIMEATLARLKS